MLTGWCKFTATKCVGVIQKYIFLNVYFDNRVFDVYRLEKKNNLLNKYRYK